MFWLITDETNVEPQPGRFFIYGGLIMTPEQMSGAHEAIQEIRQKYGFSDADDFKFETRSRPQAMTIEKWTSAKREAITAAENLGITLIIYVVLHDIAGNKSVTQITEWAPNSVVAHFDMRFLAEKMSYGASASTGSMRSSATATFPVSSKRGLSSRAGARRSCGALFITLFHAMAHLTSVPLWTSSWGECATP